MLRRVAPVLTACAAIGLLVWPTFASAADRVRITGLSDVSFGTITSFASDAIRSQSVCVYAKSSLDNYRVTAIGSGSGGGFSLASGSDTLPYEVQWSDQPGNATGSLLTPNIPLTSQHSNARLDDCRIGAPTTASLIVVVRSASVSAAIAGAYTGTVTLVIGPE